MKTSELRQKDVAGLETEVKELQKAHFNMRMQKATQQLTNITQMVLAGFVVRMVFARLANDLAVERVFDATLDQHSDGFGALGADHFANERALE